MECQLHPNDLKDLSKLMVQMGKLRSRERQGLAQSHRIRNIVYSSADIKLGKLAGMRDFGKYLKKENNLS